MPLHVGLAAQIRLDYRRHGHCRHFLGPSFQVQEVPLTASLSAQYPQARAIRVTTVTVHTMPVTGLACRPTDSEAEETTHTGSVHKSHGSSLRILAPSLTGGTGLLVCSYFPVKVLSESLATNFTIPAGAGSGGPVPDQWGSRALDSESALVHWQSSCRSESESASLSAGQLSDRGLLQY